MKYYIYISIQTLYSVLCWSNFGSDYIRVFLGITLQLGTPVFGEFLPFFSVDPLKLCQVGWGASLHSYFQVSPEMFPKPLLRCRGCVLRDIVLLEGEPSPQSESSEEIA